MKLKHLLVVFLSLFSLSALADDSVKACQPLPFLQSGFDMASYQTCSDAIRKCPMDGRFPKQSCVDKTLKDYSACNQFKQVADTIQMSAPFVSAKTEGKVTLLTVLYPADGKKRYYFISSNGCLIDSIIDPRKLDESLNKKYGTTELLAVNWQEPSYKAKNGSSAFNVLLRITKDCLACEVVGWAKEKFVFDKDGKFVKANLESFKDKQ